MSDLEHIVGTKNGVTGARTIRRLEPTKRLDTSCLGIWYQTHRTHLTPAVAFSPVHENRTDDKSISSSDSSSSSSPTQAPSGIPQHANVRTQSQTNSRSQQQTAMGAKVPSSRTHVTGRASTGKESARRRLADGRSEYVGGWSRDIWN